MSIIKYQGPAPRRIKVIPPRLPEIGRLRLGDVKTDARKPGKPLSHFRVTSQQEQVVRAVAATYGGKVSPWNGEQGNQWQVVIAAPMMEVIIPPESNFTSCFEQWAAGGCTVRCDGETASIVQKTPDGGVMVDQPCRCDPDKRECKATSRLNVILQGVEQVGVFRLETHSVYAAMELPGMVDLAAAFAAHGSFVPATLSIEDRTINKATEKFPRRFKVPVLRLAESLEHLAAGPRPLAIEGPAQPTVTVIEEQPKQLVAGQQSLLAS